jgi:hypothetical protein
MKTLLILLISALLHSCNGQNKKELLKQEETILKQDTIMKTFDIETFNKNKNNLNDYHFTLENGTIVWQHANKGGYWETLKTKDSIFESYFGYYENGKLKTTIDKRFPNNSLSIGILKEYNQQGILIKETDLDKPYTYTWEDVKTYLQNHGVTDFEKDVFNIRRWSDEKRTFWEIQFTGKYKKEEGKFVIELDGKTGEEILVKKFISKDADGEDTTISIYDTLYSKERQENLHTRYKGKDYTRKEWEAYQKTDEYKKENPSVWDSIFGKKNKK